MCLLTGLSACGETSSAFHPGYTQTGRRPPRASDGHYLTETDWEYLERGPQTNTRDTVDTTSPCPALASRVRLLMSCLAYTWQYWPSATSGTTAGSLSALRSPPKLPNSLICVRLLKRPRWCNRMDGTEGDLVCR